MKTKWMGVFSILVCVMAAVTLTDPAGACSEIFVVSAEESGDANYMFSNGDGSFSPLEILQRSSESGITANPTHGNGIGDFNNDGECDYIAGFGLGGGDIYIFEKLGPGNQFATPVKAASWNEGYYPMDLAVADFNGDGHMDFVMSYMYSASSGLYLGNGTFGPNIENSFTYFALADTAPAYSSGVDAADFNNDGFADFVVASNYDKTIFVNLGNGDGTFKARLKFNTEDENAVYGIAAADFNNDGNADIATAFHDSLIIYMGNGDGTFQWAATSHEFDLNQSPIDNYDFDGDGNQDLVVANYSSDNDGVAVLLGQGNGSFTYDDTYTGGTGGYLVAISGPPYKPDSNQEPVAVLDPIFFEITAGDTIEFDGSQSYDEDGEIIGYEWDFGDAIQAVAVSTLQIEKAAGRHSGADIQTHVYNEAGRYIVTLTVTDDKGATASVEAEVHVAAIPVPEFTVKFTPRRLDPNSRGKWIRATITVVDGYDARQIDRASVRIVPDEGSPIYAYTYSKHGFWAKLLKRYGHKRRLSVKFDRQAVIGALDGARGKTDLKLKGKVKVRHNGKRVNFSGSGTIKVIEKKKMKKVRHGWKFWRYWGYYWR